MLILSVECSAGPASAAIFRDGSLIASSFVNVKLTHSQTLMPMIASLLESARLTASDIEGFAVAAGPGSFTGIRIGISAVKGLAAPKELPCVAVSTLEGMSYNHIGKSCIVCPVMDARCNQLYNALFEIKGSSVIRLCEDRALMSDELASELIERFSGSDKQVIICGDGCDIFYPLVADMPFISKATEQLKLQSAVGVGLASLEQFASGKYLQPDNLLPSYLRLPQAERELKNKSKINNKENIK